MSKDESSEVSREEAVVRMRSRYEEEAEDSKPIVYGGAGFWRRFFAFSIDSIIVGILSTIVAFIVGSYLAP